MSGARKGAAVVRQALDEAEDYLPEAPVTETEDGVLVPLDPLPGDENDQGIRPGEWTPQRNGLPSDCPVHPLGVDGDNFWFLDTIGQLRSIPSHRFSQNAVAALFMGRHHYLYWAWPRTTKDGAVTSWRAEKARDDLMAACAIKGPWKDVEKVRWRGAWRGAKGQLILHTGTELYVYGKEIPTGELGRYVYPKRPPLPKPWLTSIAEEGNPAKLIVPMFRRWNWARPDVDPVLLLGWLGSAFLGGALPWRPTVFITGDKATGKSTLQGVLKGMLGEWLVQAADTSAAGVYQRIGNDSVPVSVDELEAEADTRKVKAVMKLARLAASGALMLRGGAEHSGVEFQARSAFVFSSINAPPLEPQDLSRMALLRLNRLTQEHVPLDRETLSDEHLGRLGEMVLRRLMDDWHRFEPTLAAYKAELAQAGHDGRGQDTFGTLLTCADLIIGQDFESPEINLPMGEDLTLWRERLKASEMAEFEDAVENWRLCLNHLLSVHVDAWRDGLKKTVGEQLVAFQAGDASYGEARDKLGQAGLGVVKPTQRGDPHWLAIPNQSPLTQRLFIGTKWGGEMGAGVWASALRQGPRESMWTTGAPRVNGVKCRCTLISIDALYGPGGLMDDEDGGQPLLS
jgi:hypothetical protein